MSNEKNDLLLRLKNSSPNLFIPHFLELRRQDWNKYLSDKTLSKSDFEDGIKKWLKEDKAGANKFLNGLQTG
jgi:hypothetical protein